jgi:hypothetical protein
MTDPAASQHRPQSGRACSADATAEGPSEESRKKQNEGLIAWARDVCSAHAFAFPRQCVGAASNDSGAQRGRWTDTILWIGIMEDCEPGEGPERAAGHVNVRKI